MKTCLNKLKKYLKEKGQNGQMLLVVMVVLMILMIVLFAVVYNLRTDIKEQQVEREYEQGYTVAEEELFKIGSDGFDANNYDSISSSAGGDNNEYWDPYCASAENECNPAGANNEFSCHLKENVGDTGTSSAIVKRCKEREIDSMTIQQDDVLEVVLSEGTSTARGTLDIDWDGAPAMSAMLVCKKGAEGAGGSEIPDEIVFGDSASAIGVDASSLSFNHHFSQEADMLVVTVSYNKGYSNPNPIESINVAGSPLSRQVAVEYSPEARSRVEIWTLRSPFNIGTEDINIDYNSRQVHIVAVSSSWSNVEGVGSEGSGNGTSLTMSSSETQMVVDVFGRNSSTPVTPSAEQTLIDSRSIEDLSNRTFGGSSYRKGDSTVIMDWDTSDSSFPVIAAITLEPTTTFVPGPSDLDYKVYRAAVCRQADCSGNASIEGDFENLNNIGSMTDSPFDMNTCTGEYSPALLRLRAIGGNATAVAVSGNNLPFQMETVRVQGFSEGVDTGAQLPGPEVYTKNMIHKRLPALFDYVLFVANDEVKKIP